MAPATAPPREKHAEALLERIRDHKRRRGAKLCILGHNYQRYDILEVSDFTGDSFLLSRRAADEPDARDIVFCGVHFMAESARILARDDQRVFLPNHRAGCPMADMADLEPVERAWEELEDAAGPGRVIPLTYMNSWAELKAFTGRHGGAICTSSNAEKAYRWSLDQGAKILFLPDEHLGRNAARALGIGGEELLLWDPSRPRGGHSAAAIRRARILLWKGYCHVHTWFSREDIARARASHPGCTVVVHPECRSEVAEEADVVGSTEAMVGIVGDLPAGTVVYIGTEIHLVQRLALENPDKTVRPLSRSLCPNQFRINLHNLLDTLEGLDEGRHLVTVPAGVRDDARLALERMLRLA